MPIRICYGTYASNAIRVYMRIQAHLVYASNAVRVYMRIQARLVLVLRLP